MTMKRKQIDTNGLHIQYLPVNQAYALMWYGTLLRIFNSRKEADQELCKKYDEINDLNMCKACIRFSEVAL